MCQLRAVVSRVRRGMLVRGWLVGEWRQGGRKGRNCCWLLFLDGGSRPADIYTPWALGRALESLPKGEEMGPCECEEDEHEVSGLGLAKSGRDEVMRCVAGKERRKK